MVSGAGEPDQHAQWEAAKRAIQIMLERDVSPKTIREVVSEIWGLPRRSVYEMIIDIRKDSGREPQPDG
jgi:hypothetical protein